MCACSDVRTLALSLDGYVSSTSASCSDKSSTRHSLYDNDEYATATARAIQIYYLAAVAAVVLKRRRRRRKKTHSVAIWECVDQLLQSSKRVDAKKLAGDQSASLVQADLEREDRIVEELTEEGVSKLDVIGEKRTIQAHLQLPRIPM